MMKMYAFFVKLHCSHWTLYSLLLTAFKKKKTNKIIELSFTHCGRVTHICVGKLTIIGSNNGLSPGRHQAIILTNAEILLIGCLGTNFKEILIEIHIFSFKKMHLKMLSWKWRPFCFGLNVLTHCGLVRPYGDIDRDSIGSGNGLLPDSTEPIPEPVLTYHQWGPVAFIWGQFHCNSSIFQWLECLWTLHV